MKKKRFINFYTGEIIRRRSIFAARLYFKRDAKKYGYEYNKRQIVEW